MRIISGTHKGRRINPPKNLPIRPTTDMAKESLFNILNNIVDFSELKVLDLFAGTGSISYEFASRQAKMVTAVDVNYRCVEFIRKTAKELQLDAVKAVRTDVFKLLRRPFEVYDLIFSDAPYDLEKAEELPDLIFDNGWLTKDAWLIIEHPQRVDFSKHPYFNQKRNYGKVNFTFFRKD